MFADSFVKENKLVLICEVDGPSGQKGMDGEQPKACNPWKGLAYKKCEL